MILGVLPSGNSNDPHRIAPGRMPRTGTTGSRSVRDGLAGADLSP